MSVERGGAGPALFRALKRNGTLLALLLGTLGLGAYLALSRGAGEGAAPGETEPLLPAGALDQARQARQQDGGAPRPLLLVLQSRGAFGAVTTLSLRRHEIDGRGRYWLDGPSTHERADDEAGEALYGALRDGRAARRLPGAMANAGRYGLDEGRYQGRLVLSASALSAAAPAGGQPAGSSVGAGAGPPPGARALRFGDEAPGELAYAAWEGEGDVLLVPQPLVLLVRRDRDAYRRHALLPDDLEPAPRRLDLGPLQLERRPSSWIVSEGGRRSRARTEEVGAILDLLRSGRPARLLDGGGLPYRGDFPALEAPVIWRPGEVRSAPFTLRIAGVEQLFYGLPCPEPTRAASPAVDGGAPDASAGAIYAVRADGARLCLRAEDGARLSPSFAALRERRLLPFPVRSISRVRMGAARLEGGGGRYTLDGRPADAGAVLHYLDALGALEGSPPPDRPFGRPGGRLGGARAAATAEARGPADRGGPAPVTPGAGDPALVLETEEGDAITLRVLPGGCGAAVCVARDDEEPLALPAAALPLLRLDPVTGPLRFLPRTLLAVPPATVTAVTLERQADHYPTVAAERRATAKTERRPTSESAERRGGTWTLFAPVPAPADAVHLGRLLSLLSDLRALRWIAPSSRPTHGLGALRLRIRAGGAEQVLLLGPEGAEGCAAQAGAGPVGLLPRELCEALGRPLSVRELLLLDESRLQEVSWSGSEGRHVLSRAGRAYLLDGQPRDAAPILAALRRLDQGEPGGAGEAGPRAAAPLLTIEVRHAPLGLPAAPDSTVAPPTQRLRIYKGAGRATGRPASGGAALLGVLDGRDITYTLAAGEADLRALR